MKSQIILLTACLAGCGSPREAHSSETNDAVSVESVEQAPSAASSAEPRRGPAQSPPSPGLPDDGSPVSEEPFTEESAQGAANLVQIYFAHLEAGDATEARPLWSKSSVAREAQFRQSLHSYREFHTQVGSPGGIEAAAGSAYVRVPVQISGRLNGGGEFNLLGEAALRRSNGGPAAGLGDGRWHIVDIAIGTAR